MKEASTYNKSKEEIHMEKKIETKKYCKFTKDLYDGETKMFDKNNEYLVTDETEKIYYFGILAIPRVKGISKEYENKLYIVISNNKRE